MDRRLLMAIVSISYAAISAGQSSNGAPPSETTQNFIDTKAQHLATLQKEIACVEVATSFETMHACSPRPPGAPMGPPPGGPHS
jgi:hypothetical protein